MNIHSQDSLALVYLYTEHFNFKAQELRNKLESPSSPADILREIYSNDVDSILSATELKIHEWESSTDSQLSTPYDAFYPQQLLNVWDHPLLIFRKGKLDFSNTDNPNLDIGVSIVGSRDASEAAKLFTKYLVNYLCDENLTIISGLAEGIDQTAHITALQRNSRTVGVIGTGLGRYYPRSSRDLQMRMEDNAGKSMVLSQFLPGTQPTRASFPMRNGVMSAYGLASIIVEASEKSGTRHQAAQAVKHGRALILSKQVATETSWGRKYAEDPNIETYVVDTPHDAAAASFDVIEKVMRPSLDLSVTTDTFSITGTSMH